VGDLAFQRKCLDKVEQFQREGRTIVFVTHAPDQVVRICDRAIILNKGRIVKEGSSTDVVRDFRKLMSRQHLAYGWDHGTKEIEIVSAEIFGENGQTRDVFFPGEQLAIQLDLKANVPMVEDPIVSFAIHDDQNRLVYGTNTDWGDARIPRFEGKQRIQFLLKSLPFVDGRFYVTLGVHSKDFKRVYHLQEQRYSFDVVRGEKSRGVVWIPVEYRVERL
jgi:ABC-type glutathione transport system ATPase component